MLSCLSPCRCLTSALAVFAWVVPSWAQCSIQLRGDVTDDWRRSASQLEVPRTTRDDCNHVEVEIAAEEARIAFTTIDGRRAERVVRSPSELVAAVEALRATGTTSVATSRAFTPAPTTTSPPIGERRANTSSALPAVLSTVTPGPLVSLGVGARGGADNLVSPMAGGGVALGVRHWELGVLISMEFRYFDLDDRKRSTTSAVGAGVAVGRREPLGPAFVLYGGRLVLASLNDGTDGDAEVRLGSYVGAALPRGAPVRFRADAAFDFVPQNIGGPSEDDCASPWLALSLLLGVEFGGT